MSEPTAPMAGAPIWAILYDDQDRSPEIFTGEGARAAAEATFSARKLNWSCYLLSSVHQPSPAPVPLEVAQTYGSACCNSLEGHHPNCPAAEGEHAMPDLPPLEITKEDCSSEPCARRGHCDLCKVRCLTRQLRSTLAQLAQAQADKRKAEARLEWHLDRHSCRVERLAQWAREDLPEDLKRQFFNIYANGTKEHHEEPVYAQRLNRMKYRAESAEADNAALRTAMNLREEGVPVISSMIAYRNEQKSRADALEAENAALKQQVAEMKNISRVREKEVDLIVDTLGDLAAVVRGECPSLLNEDSGGDAELSLRIDDILDGHKSRTAELERAQGDRNTNMEENGNAK